MGRTAPMRRCLILYGITCIIGQVLALREISVLFHGNELVYGAVLAAWLLLFAAGSGVLGRVVRHRRLGIPAFVLTLAGAGVMVPVTLLLARSAHRVLIGPDGITPGLGPILLTTLIVLAPLCLLLGFFYSLACAIEMRRRESPAVTATRVYVFEALGTFIGGALFTYLLVHIADAFLIALAVAAVNCAAAFAVWRHGPWPRPLWGWALAPLAGLFLLCVVSPVGLALDALSQTLRFPGRRLRVTRDTPYGRIDVLQASGQTEFYQSGALAAVTHSERKAEETAVLALLAHPAPKRALVIGGHLTGVLRKALSFPGLQVDYVELDPELIRMARRFAPAQERAALNAKRARVFTRVDGRTFVKRTRTRYDVIICTVPNPSTGVTNRFYTAEFFAEARRVLVENGVLFISIDGAPAYMSAPHRALAAGVYQTLKSVFGRVAVLPVEDGVCFLATPARATQFPNTAAWPGRLSRGRLTPFWLTGATLREITNPARVAQVRSVMESTPVRALNRDLHPLAYYHALLLWTQAFKARGGGLMNRALDLDLPALLAAIALVTALVGIIAGFSSHPARAVVPTVSAYAGMAGFVLQLSLIFAFQGIYGYAYSHLGIIFAAFMVGAALGALIVPRLGVARIEIRVLMLLQTILAVLAAAVGPLLTLLARTGPASAQAWALAGIPALNLIIGALVGAQYPLCVAACSPRTLPADRRATLAAGLYAMDLVGACIGALLGAALLIPVLGITRACLAISALSVASLPLLLIAEQKKS